MKTSYSVTLIGRLGVVVLLLAVASIRAQDSTVSNALPVISLVTPDAVASEAGDPGRFVLVRQGPTNQVVHVFLRIGGTASNGVDYLPIPNWISIPAGIREVPVPVQPLVDTEAEGPETVVLKLLPPPMPPPTPYAIGTPDQGVVTLYENAVNPPPPNIPVVTVRAIDPEAVEPIATLPPNPGVFRVFRDGKTNDQLNVRYSLRGTASNGVDYLHLPGEVVVPAGQREADIVVRPQPDNLFEGLETVVLRLDDMAWIAIYPPPPGIYAVGIPREAVATILDNHPQANLPPKVKIVKPFDGQMFPPSVRIPIVVETVDPDGYVPRVEFFANGELLGVREKMFMVQPPPGETIPYDFVWTNAPVGRHVLAARATDNRGLPAWSGPVVVWVAGSNAPTIVTIGAVDPIAAEGTNCLHWTGITNPPSLSNACYINPARFVVRRTGPTNEALTVHYRTGGTASNGVDYVELSGVVTIPAGCRAADIRAIPIDDALPEPAETVILGLQVPPVVLTVLPPYHIGWPGRAAAVIVDNDGPRPPLGVLADRSFHLALPGENGRWFRVDCSTDGVNWTPAGTVQVEDGALHFVDPEAEELPLCLYRAVPVEAPSEN